MKHLWIPAVILLLAGIVAGGTSYVQANGQTIAKLNDTGVYYYHSDHLGSTSAVTSSKGEVVEEQINLPFGELISGSERYGFTSKELDETGLNYFSARYYNPEIGRFVTLDSAMDGVNWYSYAAGNPLKFIDPSGTTLIPFVIGLHSDYPDKYDDVGRQRVYNSDKYGPLDPDAVKQGAYNTCTPLAIGGGMAGTPQGIGLIRGSMVDYDLSGYFTFGNGETVKPHVPGSIRSFFYGNAKPGWGKVLEAAFFEILSKRTGKRYKTHSERYWFNGNDRNGISTFEVMEIFTGAELERYPRDILIEAEVLKYPDRRPYLMDMAKEKFFEIAKTSNIRPLIIQTKKKFDGYSPKGILPNHVYFFKYYGVNENAGREIILRNPWGRDVTLNEDSFWNYIHSFATVKLGKNNEWLKKSKP